MLTYSNFKNIASNTPIMIDDLPLLTENAKLARNALKNSCCPRAQTLSSQPCLQPVDSVLRKIELSNKLNETTYLVYQKFWMDSLETVEASERLGCLIKYADQDSEEWIYFFI